MRIFYDARSVRTPAGKYVFHGLVNGWRLDGRVEAVMAGVSPEFDATELPDGVEAVRLGQGSWISHVTTALPRASDYARADIVFVPNGVPPKDPRAVIYFQDLYQFKSHVHPGTSLRTMAFELARAVWRNYAAPTCRLAIPVSTDIHHEVVRRLRIPITMIPNGVDVGSIRWTGGSNRVVIMGGHGARKGEHHALRAWAHLPPRARHGLGMDLIGVEPAARRKELSQLADELRLSEHVAIHGALPREDFLARVAASELAVSCSRLEAFGLPVAEALVMGAPLIASDIPSHRELVARAGAGETVKAGDEVALARRLAQALDGNPPKRLTNVPLGWSWRERARQHIDAYQSAS